MTTTPTTSPDIEEARKWAAHFRSRGFCPLPSDPSPADGRKKPLCRYTEYYEAAPPDDLFERFPTSNIQVLAGRHWRLLVIDLDGRAGQEWFFGLGRPIPRTWGVRSGGGEGLHLWFRLPERYPRELPKAFLWKGDGKHEGVERLCDRSLVMAPPSLHPTTGNRYRWANDAQFAPPTKMALPADCPRWVLDLEPVRTARPEIVPFVRADVASLKPVAGGHYRAADVLDAIPDKLALVASWGIKFTGRERAGWAECHAIGREDRNPSAAVNRATGHYRDLGPSGASLTLFGLAEYLGVASDWRDALSDLGSRFHARVAS